jgi:outer membrane protein insertion porin family
MRIERFKFTFFSILFPVVIVVSLHAGANEKYKIKSVKFEGNFSFTHRQLHRVMVSRPSSFLNPSVYNPDILQEDVKTLERFYHQQGYLEASVLNHTVRIDSARKKVFVLIELVEGERTYVEEVGVFGNCFFSKALLLEQVSIRIGNPFLKKSLEASTLALLKRYANSGFLNTRVDPAVRLNTDIHRVIIDFNIQENHQFSIDRISTIGLEKTLPRVIHRELLFQSDDIINYSKLLESQRRIYLTGLFQNVFVHPKPAASGDSLKKDIAIELKENKSVEFNVAAGYGTVEKLRGRVEIVNINLRGTAQRAGVAGKVSFIHYGAELSFSEPYTFRTRWRTDINFYTGFKKEPGYSMDYLSGQLSIGRQFFKKSNVTMTYREEHAKLYDIKVYKIPDDVRTNVRSLKLSLIHDTRNNLFNPSKGVYVEYSNELGGTFSEVISGFLRSIVSLKYFVPWSNSTVFATALEIGWINVSSGIGSIPLQERFYIGGPNSIRGFKYKKLGPLDIDGTPTGGRLKIQWNLIEIRRRLYKTLGLALFVDAGNVYQNPKQFNFQNMRLTPGVGLRFNSPIGVARFDFAVNPEPRNGEKRYQWILGIGQAF